MVAALIKDLYSRILGGTAPAGAALATGDIGQMLKFVVSLTGGATRMEQFPAGSPAAFAAATIPTKYTDLATGVNADTAPNSVDVHPDNAFIARALSVTSPYVGVWRFAAVSGWGAKLSDPSTAFTNGQTMAVRWHPNGNWLFVSSSVTPFLACYAFDKVNGIIGTRSTDLSGGALPTATPIKSIDISPDGLTVLVSGQATPYVEAWAFNPATGAWGSKYSAPATLPTGLGYQAKFSLTGLQVVVGHTTAPNVTAYPWTNASGFGTKFADPATAPSTTVQGLDFGGDSLILALSGTPYIYGYPWSASGFGTKYTDPATLPGGGANALAFNRLGTHVVCSTGVSPYLDGYPVTPSGFGTKIAAPTSTPANTAGGIAWAANADGEVLIASLGAGPYAYAAPFKFGGLFIPSFSTTAVGVVALTGALKVLYSSNSKFGLRSLNYEPGTHYIPVGVDRVIFGSVVASAKGQISGYG